MSKRFTVANATALVKYLKASGIDPDATTTAPTKSWNGGCSDPGCCVQHPGRTPDGKTMLTVKTTVSASRLHRIAVSLGLI